MSARTAVRLCVLGISYFYGLAGALYLTLFEVSRSVHLNQVVPLPIPGVYMATLGWGYLRQFPGHAMTTHQVEIGLIPMDRAD